MDALEKYYQNSNFKNPINKISKNNKKLDIFFSKVKDFTKKILKKLKRKEKPITFADAFKKYGGEINPTKQTELNKQFRTIDLNSEYLKKITLTGTPLMYHSKYNHNDDDKQFLVVIDTEGGRLSRLSLNDYSSESSEFKLFTYKNNETGNPETTSYGIIMLGEKLSDVVINTKTLGIEISNGKVDPRLIVGMQSIYEDTLNSVTFKVIEKDIELGSYSHGMSKDQDIISTARISGTKRSIDIDEFIQDYIETKKLIPGIDKQGTAFADMSEKLIDTTFEAHMLPAGTANQQLYNRQKYALVTDMKQLLQERQRENNERNVEELHKRLNDDLENLNSTVDKATSKENIGILVGRKEASNEFLRSAVDGTKTRARTSGMQNQIELIKQRELFKRGLIMKNTWEKGQEYGDN